MKKKQSLPFLILTQILESNHLIYNCQNILKEKFIKITQKKNKRRQKKIYLSMN